MRQDRAVALMIVLMAGLAGVSLAPGPALAGLVTFQATHLVAASTVEGVAIGDRLVTTFSFDTSTPDLDPDPHRGRFEIGPPAAGEPAWTVANGNDPGVALLELFAYVADTLAFFQDQIADEADLATADQRGVPRLRLRLRIRATTVGDDLLTVLPPDPGRVLADGSFYEIVLARGTIVGGDLIALSRVSGPGSLALVSLGLGLLGVVRRRASVG